MRLPDLAICLLIRHHLLRRTNQDRGSMMAKRKKGSKVQKKRGAAARGKARKVSKSARAKATKRTVAKAKPKRASVKKAAPKAVPVVEGSWVGNLIIVTQHSPHKRRFWCSGLMIPNSSIAVFKADVSSGASTIPMNAPGDPLMR